MTSSKVQYDHIILDLFCLFKEMKSDIQSHDNYDLIVKKIRQFDYTEEQLDAVIAHYTKKINRRSSKPNNKSRSKKISKSISEIKDVNQLRDFYHDILRKYFNPSSSDEQKKEILNSVTLNDLIYLHSLISSVKLPQSRKKTEVLSLLRMYFENESRTNSLKL